MNQADLHNRLAASIVASIVEPPIEAGGRATDVLVLLESVIVGVLVVVARPGGDAVVIERVMEGVKSRLAAWRVAGRETAGSARLQ